ncbi:MAG: alginate lyase family protein [Coriobacteriia bacterium]|nr:alginate lyase family protein [Coriobacteriia bacterium]
MIPQTDLDPDYLLRFDVEGVLNEEICLLNERHKVDLELWNVPEASHLWNFNLHYFEYCIPLAAKWSDTGDNRYWLCFKRLVESWIAACEYPLGDGWHPYTISLRLVNWLVCRELFEPMLSTDAEFDKMLLDSMYAQYRHLAINQETHLLANHYFENLKALVICSKLFGDDCEFERSWRNLEGQLEEQILQDGVHFERSLMYHKLVLEGILRISFVLRQIDGSEPEILRTKASSMLDAMVSLEKGMGKTPFFNDSADGVSKSCSQLSAACLSIFQLEACDAVADFPFAGYYKLYSDDGRFALMVDVGEPGPPYMLGHSHCDALSFELSVDGVPVIINSGTYGYQSELRSYFRSTAAHNTVQYGSCEQMQCWGEHRVASSYESCSVVERSGNLIRAVLTLRNGIRLERCIQFRADSLVISDTAVNGADECLVSRIHIASGNRLDAVSSDSQMNVEQQVASREFGLLENVETLVFKSSDSIVCSIDCASLRQYVVGKDIG